MASHTGLFFICKNDYALSTVHSRFSITSSRPVLTSCPQCIFWPVMTAFMTTV